MSELKTDCSKCGAKMPPSPTIKGVLGGLRMAITAYRCETCGHWNDLKRRKGYRQATGSQQ